MPLMNSPLPSLIVFEKVFISLDTLGDEYYQEEYIMRRLIIMTMIFWEGAHFAYEKVLFSEAMRCNGRSRGEVANFGVKPLPSVWQ